MTTANSSRRRIRIVSAGLLLTVIVLLAHQYLPDQISSLAHETIRSLHGPGFGVVALIIMMMLRDSERPVTSYARAAVFSMVLAVVAEVAQIPGPRKAEIADLLADALGILAFLGMAAIFDKEGRTDFQFSAVPTEDNVPQTAVTQLGA